MSDLKARYIYAAVKKLPRACRKDIEMELSTLIDDMLEERCGENAPTEKDLRVVLTEIGTPAEVYSKYSPDAGKALITEEYYPHYKRWMIIILCAAVGSVAFSHLLSGLLGEMAPLTALAEGIAKCIASALSAFGAVTILFIILQKKGKKLGHPADTIENLPPVPKKKDTIPVADGIVGIALSVAAAVLLLCFPQTICIGMDGYGCYSVFWTQHLQAAWLPIALFAAAGVVRHALQLIWRKRSVKLLIASAVCDAIGIVCLFIALLGDEIINPAFLQIAQTALLAEEPFVQQMVMHFNVTLATVIAAAIAIDLISDAVHTLKK